MDFHIINRNNIQTYRRSKTRGKMVESIQEILRKIEDLKNLGNFQEAFHILEKIHNTKCICNY